eukprot:1233083-Rhodomonas_salina.1
MIYHCAAGMTSRTAAPMVCQMPTGRARAGSPLWRLFLNEHITSGPVIAPSVTTHNRVETSP